MDSVFQNAKAARGLYCLNTRANVAAGSSETVVAQYEFAAGSLNLNDRLRIWSTFSKSGATDTGTINVKIGTAGTVADTTVYGGTAFNAASRTLGSINEFKIASATTAQHLGTDATAPLSGSYIGVNSSNAYPAAVTIPNISNALYLTVTVTPGATDDIALEDLRLELLPTP